MQELPPEAASPETRPSCRLRSPSGGSLPGGGEAPPRLSPSTAATQSRLRSEHFSSHCIRYTSLVNQHEKITSDQTSIDHAMSYCCSIVSLKQTQGRGNLSTKHPSACASKCTKAAPWPCPLLLRGRSCGEERALLAASPSRSTAEPSGTASTMEWRPPAHRLITRHRPGPPAAGRDVDLAYELVK